MQGSVTGLPRMILRIEGLLVLVVATMAYAALGGHWWLFAALFLVPDLSMAGYLFGPAIGAASYNVGHNYALPLAMIGLGLLFPISWAVLLGLIWSAHIGFDRALGFGLKYAGGFGLSHLGQIGRARAASQD